MFVYSEDLEVNKNNTKGKFIVRFFRLTHFFISSDNFIYICLGKIINIFYKIIMDYLLGVKLPAKLKIGKGLCIYHGLGLVIHENTIIDDNVTLRNNTTIGNKYKSSCPPVFGNNITVGANSVIIGNISIGNNVTIGAGSVVTKSIPSNCTVVGNPARIIPDSRKK